jgi:hypothetical protein
MIDSAEKSFDSSFAFRVLNAISRRRGQRVSVTVRLGQPYWVTEGEEAACMLSLDGLYGRQPDIHGIDPLDAIRNAVILAENLLKGASDEYELYWPNGEPYEPID